jgi:D-sedoheptulose 7-phosphate isomerase
MNGTIQTLLQRYPLLQECGPAIRSTLELLIRTYEGGGKLLICGNGGSASDSEHIVGELMKGFLQKRPITAAQRESLVHIAGDSGQRIADALQGCLPAIALTSHDALSTAVANDISGDMVFAQQVYGLAQAGDALLGISTSGNSQNVVNAFYVAKLKGATTIALTGRNQCALADLADIAIQVPADNTPAIQELHLPIYHAWCIALEAHFFPE